jgi:hypothetical protein
MQEKTKKTTRKPRKTTSKSAVKRTSKKTVRKTTTRATRKTTPKKKTVTKKAVAKKVERKTQPSLAEKLAQTTTTTSSPAPKISNKKLFVVFLIAVVVFVLYILKDKYIAAVVNGQPVYRHTLHMELEKQAGQQALDGLVTKTLIYQEAKKQNVEVTQEEVDAQLSEIEAGLAAQGQTLDEIIALQGLTKEDVIEQIKLQLMIEKMVGDEVVVTDEAVDDYMEQNADFLPEDADEEELKASVREQLRQQQLSLQIQEWIEDIQDKAEVKNYLFPETEVMVEEQVQ